MPTEGLLLGFLLTNLKGIKGSDIHMPLQSFIIELPVGVAYTMDPTPGDGHGLMKDVPYTEITEDGREVPSVERLHPLNYIIVTEGENPGIGRSLLVYTFSGANPESSTVFDAHVMYFSIDISDPSESLDAVLNTFEEVRVEQKSEFRGGDYYEDTSGLVFGEGFTGGEFRDRVLRIVINTILYMNSASAVAEHAHLDEIEQLKTQKKKGKIPPYIQQQIEKLEDDPYYILGTDITITKADLDVWRSYEAPGEPGTGRKLTRPSITRGHWKRQPYGPRSALRKPVWIKPYIRGKELGDQGLPVVAHRYTVKNPLEEHWGLDDDHHEHYSNEADGFEYYYDE